VVEHPFDRNVEEAESSIGIEEDNKLVVVDVVCERRGFDPGSVSVFEFAGLYKLVVVAVDERVRVVVENATRNVVDVAPVVFASVVCLRRL
jgi:regulator of protease activity HflC (stomatin/prohibitin superfamily)